MLSPSGCSQTGRPTATTRSRRCPDVGGIADDCFRPGLHRGAATARCTQLARSRTAPAGWSRRFCGYQPSPDRGATFGMTLSGSRARMAAASWNTANEKHASRDSGVLVVVRLDSLLGCRQDRRSVRQAKPVLAEASRIGGEFLSLKAQPGHERRSVRSILGWAGALTAPWSPPQETTGHELLRLATLSVA